MDLQIIREYFGIRGKLDIHDDVVDVKGDVTIRKNTDKLPCQFGKVTGDFDCHTSGLKSLVGSPKFVGGNFECWGNPLTSFEGMPDTVEGWFQCDCLKNVPILLLLKFNTCVIMNNDTVGEIIKKYSGQKPLRQAIIQCQRELIDAGFEGNARL